MSLFVVSCVTQHKAVMGDAIRFSDDAQTSYTHKDGKFKNLSNQSTPYELYGRNGVNYGEVEKLKKFIHYNHGGSETAGYYALDLGLDRVNYVRRHYFKYDPSTKFYIIYMTDGLDNTSVQVARNHKQLWFTTRESSYAKQIQQKIKRTMGLFKLKQNTFKIFPIMFIGNDVKKNMEKRGLNTIEDVKREVAKEMQYYRGASRGTAAPEVLLGTDFNEITKDFKEMFASSGFEFYVPVGYRGQRIRMNLVNEKGEEVQVEGTLKKCWFQWCLTNITYSPNVTILDQRLLYLGKPLKKLYARNGKDTKATSAIFRMDEIKLNGKNYKVTAATQEHGKYYETNSEYKLQRLDNSDAYIMLVMDESVSLGEHIKEEQKTMSDIVDIIMKSTNQE